MTETTAGSAYPNLPSLSDPFFPRPEMPSGWMFVEMSICVTGHTADRGGLSLLYLQEMGAGMECRQ